MTKAEYLRLEDQVVITRDGVHLATDVYLPQFYKNGADSKLPTIIERTPYGKQIPSRSEIHDGKKWTREEVACYFVKRGYAFIYQDCRGCYKSKGTFVKYINEGRDGYDTMEWILQQPWSNGKIGTLGLSYAAHTQLSAACLSPPGLICMCLDSGGFFDSYEEGIRRGGAFDLKQVTWAFNQAVLQTADDPTKHKSICDQDLNIWFKYMPWKPKYSPLRSIPNFENYLFEQWKNEDFSPYWTQNGLFAKGSFKNMPKVATLIMSSWYDAYVINTIRNFNAMKIKNPENVKLIMGPWIHGNRNDTFSGDADFGASSKLEFLGFNWLEMRLAWFDKYLKGIDSSNQNSPNKNLCTVFLMGGGTGKKDRAGRIDHGGRWISSQSYPPIQRISQPFYLSQNCTLSTRLDHQFHKITYSFDPQDPCPTIGGATTSGYPIFAGGAFNQVLCSKYFGSDGSNLPLHARHDVVAFETDPLDEDIIVIGDIQADIYITCDCPDTDIVAKLIDIYPPNSSFPEGYFMNIADGIFRCRYHESFDHPNNLSANEIYKIQVNLGSTANVFSKGHMIGLYITSSNFPHYDVNPNTGESAMGSRHTRPANITVHYGHEDFPSNVILPIIPKKDIDCLD